VGRGCGSGGFFGWLWTVGRSICPEGKKWGYFDVRDELGFYVGAAAAV
jgi:hypothetical protein